MPALGASLVYILIGAADWRETFVKVTVELESGISQHTAVAAGLSISLYIVRHVYLYYGLSKWLIQWDKQLFNTGSQNGVDNHSS